ncbi:uncharacterized protein LOC121422009 [Lytechinus variegatus]|uniref:uncharacterized protein LOC121422009 n=1 Tax=Lytechinus variegatus TaxID=7654 RepID=UPI001BB14ADF|nr:uncharacterized protein LOC121422009 [Lytechinus variegatus]
MLTCLYMNEGLIMFMRGLFVFWSTASFASIVSSTKTEKPVTSCSDGFSLDYTLSTFHECKNKLHPNGSMVQTIPKLIPYTTFNKGVACQRRDRSRATGKTPGHRVCSLPDCHNNICQGGWCEETMTAFKCHCYDGYEGKLCDQQSTSKQNITTIDSNKTTSSPTTMPLENDYAIGNARAHFCRDRRPRSQDTRAGAAESDPSLLSGVKIAQSL